MPIRLFWGCDALGDLFVRSTFRVIGAGLLGMSAISAAQSAAATQTAASSASTVASDVNNQATTQLAGNFNEFLQLLTTQLQNQDPLSPMDTNQFTQQLVEFSSVEQQININTNLGTLISLQQANESAQAVSFLGKTVAVSGNATQLQNGQASWGYSVSTPAVATINISNSTGQVVYSTTQAIQPGQQTYTWNGVDANGITWPDGLYTLSMTAVDANGQNTAVTTQSQGVVTAVDVSKTPPNLTVNGQAVPLNQILQFIQ
jgi:flagellar basal-body rod modification protein FlgD